MTQIKEIQTYYYNMTGRKFILLHSMLSCDYSAIWVMSNRFINRPITEREDSRHEEATRAILLSYRCHVCQFLTAL
jgi:DNA-binding ferritin-like protein